MTKGDLEDLLKPLFNKIGGRQPDESLERELNQAYPVEGPFCQAILGACRQGHADGWICEREAAGIRYGRVIKHGPATNGFSVDVVQMRQIVGPHHRHPNGEIDLILLEGQATFDHHPAGWLVYGPGTAHRPTVEGGCAYVVYFLPGGTIDFALTKS